MTESKTRRTCRVLLVDDDDGVRKAYKAILDRHHDVEVAEGGAEALARLNGDAAFGAIVRDLMMPDVAGMAVFERLHRNNPQMAERVVFWTGGIDNPRVTAFTANISNPVLSKPLTRDELLDALDELIDRLGPVCRSAGG